LKRTTNNERDPQVDLARARTVEETEWARAGIPARYWDTILKQLKFRSCGFGTQKKGPKVTAAQQRQALRQVIVEPMRQLVVLGSFPTDEGALAAASSVLCQAAGEGAFVQMIDAAYARERLPKETNIYAVHNLMNHSSNERVEQVRDLLLRWRRPAKLVVVAGCKDPYSFCVNRLCLRPDAVGFIADPS